MRMLAALIAPFAMTAVPASAAEPDTGRFPTHEIVRYVDECMVDHGGQSWGNLYNCSCKFDVIAAELDYDQFVAADTAKRGQSLAGERGGVLRETEMAEDLREDFEALEQRAEGHCFMASKAQAQQKDESE